MPEDSSTPLQISELCFSYLGHLKTILMMMMMIYFGVTSMKGQYFVVVLQEAV